MENFKSIIRAGAAARLRALFDLWIILLMHACARRSLASLWRQDTSLSARGERLKPDARLEAEGALSRRVQAEGPFCRLHFVTGGRCWTRPSCSC